MSGTNGYSEMIPRLDTVELHDYLKKLQALIDELQEAVDAVMDALDARDALLNNPPL